MAMAEKSALRGFDSFKVSLGDEMRGRRATLGKSVLDVQRELRIRASHVEAIENADPRGIPYAGFVTGYVRAYARYLGMDEDDVLRRFCVEAGYTPQAGPHAKAPTVAPRALSAAVATPRADLDALIAGSRLAAVSRAEALAADLGSTLRAATSLAVLALLIGGLGYGGWAVLRNIQQVEFAPSPEAPAALSNGPDLAAAPGAARAAVPPAPPIDSAALAAVYAAQEAATPKLTPRDGPIAAIDPDRSGFYVDDEAAAQGEAGTPERGVAGAAGEGERATRGEAAASSDLVEAPPPPPPQGLALIFEGEVWVRVRDAGGAVIHEALETAGSRWEAPEGAEGLTLRAGNAGGLFVEVDGTRLGPFGRAGEVVSNVALDREALRADLPAFDGAETASR